MFRVQKRSTSSAAWNESVETSSYLPVSEQVCEMKGHQFLLCFIWNNLKLVFYKTFVFSFRFEEFILLQR